MPRLFLSNFGCHFSAKTKRRVVGYRVGRIGSFIEILKDSLPPVGRSKIVFHKGTEQFLTGPEQITSSFCGLRSRIKFYVRCNPLSKSFETDRSVFSITRRTLFSQFQSSLNDCFSKMRLKFEIFLCNIVNVC